MPGRNLSVSLTAYSDDDLVHMIDRARIKERLSEFFTTRCTFVSRFGSTVNQAFEAFIVAALVTWYKKSGWDTRIIPPKCQGGSGQPVSLKLGTQGRPSRYSSMSCQKDGQKLHVRQQLRVATYYHKDGTVSTASVCRDVAVYLATGLSDYSTNDPLPNSQLVTFGEARHMPAFAELVAGFIGLVHEIQPRRLKRKRSSKNSVSHVPPFP